MKMIWLFPTSFSLSDERESRKVTAHELSRRARYERRRARQRLSDATFGGSARRKPPPRRKNSLSPRERGGVRGKLQSGFA
jgi:hypothetical protein